MNGFIPGGNCCRVTVCRACPSTGRELLRKGQVRKPVRGSGAKKDRSRKTSLLVGAVCLLLLGAMFLPDHGCLGDEVKTGGREHADRSARGVSPLVNNKLLGLFTHSVRDHMNGVVPASERPYIKNPRIYVHWANVEKEKGRFLWTGLDAEVNAALSMGVDSIFMTLGGAIPAWARDPAWPVQPGKGLPKDIRDWENFCKAVAARYKGVVGYYQIWQEPGWDRSAPPVADGVMYFSGEAEWDYMPLLKAGYNGIKKADPNAYVMTGSLFAGLTRQIGDYANYDVLLAGGNQDISMKVEAGADIVAERPMYFNYRGSWDGGTVEQGIPTPKTLWYLAEGATHQGFDEWICIQNPNSVDTAVYVTYMFPGGGTRDQSFTVKARSRFTVDVNSAVGPDRDVSARVASTRPVVVERPMYFNYHGKWKGGSIESGVSELSNKWYLAEGATHPGFEEWISLMNPNSAGANVRITYMFQGGGTKVQNLSMPPTSRETVLVNDIVGPGRDVSALVESSQPVIAERPMYFLYGNAWDGGHTQVGALAPAGTWMLAEGTTRSNADDGSFDEWISIMNPGGATAQVALTYMFEGGSVQTGHKTVAAHSRETIKVNDVVGPDKDVSVKLDSDQPVVVERPTYFNYGNRVAGGDVELGITRAGRTWYFAEGTSREGFQEWLTLQNPGASQTTATITFMFGDNTTGTRRVTLPAKSRTTVGVNQSVSMAAYCDGVAINPYHYPEHWAEYYNNVRAFCAKHGWGQREVVVSEIGWPHHSDKLPHEYSAEGQRAATGEKGLLPLYNAGCRKIWLYEDVDDPPGTAWDVYDGLFYHQGAPTPAWGEYKKWQSQLPDYPNLPSRMPAMGPGMPAGGGR